MINTRFVKAKNMLNVSKYDCCFKCDFQKHILSRTKLFGEKSFRKEKGNEVKYGDLVITIHSLIINIIIKVREKTDFTFIVLWELEKGER